MLEELLICYMSMKLQIFSQFYAIDASAILNAEDISGTNFEYVRNAEKQMTMNLAPCWILYGVIKLWTFSFIAKK